MPNQFGLDNFDFDDALVSQKECMCSSDLKTFMEKFNLDCNLEGNKFNPRLAFGSASDSDHVYNTPRAWYMAKRLGHNEYSPEDDNIPWSLKPNKKITVEDVKYLLSSHYQGTPYDPYGKGEEKDKSKYRPIGISRTSFMACLEVRNNVAPELSAVEWICFGSNPFNAFVPLYANVKSFPKYFSEVTTDVSTNNLYWNSRLIACLADSHFNICSIHIERYQNAVANAAHNLLNKYDSLESPSDLEMANQEISDMAQLYTQRVLNTLTYVVSCAMKNGFARSDN